VSSLKSEMNDRDIESLRGDYNKQLTRANKLEKKLEITLEIAYQQKESLNRLSAENSKLLRKIKRTQNRK